MEGSPNKDAEYDNQTYKIRFGISTNRLKCGKIEDYMVKLEQANKPNPGIADSDNE